MDDDLDAEAYRLLLAPVAARDARPANKMKPNTRFLRHIVSEANSHNAALLVKEAADARRRLKRLMGSAQRAVDTIESVDEDEAPPDGEHRRRRRTDRPDDHDEDGEDSKDGKDGHRRQHDSKHRHHHHHRSHRDGSRRDRHDDDGARSKDRGMLDDDDKHSSSRSRSHHHHHRRRHLLDESDGDAATDDNDKSRRRLRRARHRSRSQSPDRGDRDDRQDRHDRYDLHGRRERHEHHERSDHVRSSRHRRRTQSPEHGERRESRPSRSQDRRRERSPLRRHRHEKDAGSNDDNKVDTARLKSPNKAALASLSSASSASSASASDSEDPLDAFMGPQLPSDSGRVRIRGRGAHAARGIDRHFAADYDPSLDVEPLSPQPPHGLGRSGSTVEDARVEMQRDHQLRMRDGVARLRAAGFTDKEIAICTRGGKRPAAEAIPWAKPGEAREWDRGKIAGDDGPAKPLWAR